MTLFRKYWRTILYFLIIGVIFFIFDPAQRKFYLKSDVERFEKSSRWFLILLEFLTLFLWLFFSDKSRKSFTQLLVIVIATLVFTGLFYMFFQDSVISIALLINRQGSKAESKRSYVVGYLDDDKRNRYSLFLYDFIHKDDVTDKNALESVYPLDPDALDTIQLTFKKGVFGIEYFGGPVAAKRRK